VSGPALRPISRAATIGCGDIATNLNLFRRLQAAGSRISFGPFVKHRQEPTSRVLSTF